MGLTIKLFILLMISTCHLGFGDKPYKVIKFKVPHSVWKQALNPTPVLKSPVTITVPINVQDEDIEDDSEIEEDEVVDEIETEAPPVLDTVVETANVTQVLQDPVQAVSTAAPAATQSPVLQDGVAGQQPSQGVPGQVTRFPCACRSRQCGCCTGALMDRFRMKACGNITFVPEDFVFDVRMSINNNTVVRRRVSASDPPPICFNPRRAPFVRICAEISNIQIRNRNAHACLDINADIGGFPVYSASFRCFRLGASGVQTGLKPRPVSSGPKPVSLYGNSNNDDDGGGGFLENAAGNVFGGDGLFGGGGSSDDGPFDGIGDAFGDLFDGDS
ncbi:hypothetical protein PYW07_007044 [Mythimna separata]|uniref:DUF4773 domain-containing protein n=1 Tax=Mythimna separata TaxID=271217 RepID=A0AAD7YZV2_MYTSE|nr:hypothetical protein PYW07_007044 [Mythimna separata]